MKPLPLGPGEPGQRDGLLQAGSKPANRHREEGKGQRQEEVQKGVPRSAPDQCFSPLNDLGWN